MAPATPATPASPLTPPVGTLGAPAPALVPTSAAAPPAAIPKAPRSNFRVRARAWLRLAYTDLESNEHRVLLEWVVSLVIVSIVATVLEHDPVLHERYRIQFDTLEVIVLISFVLDYAFNIGYAQKKIAYVLSFWGITDLIAILPGLLLFSNVTTLKLLRGLRFLRFLRVAKIAREAQRRAQALDVEERQSVFLDLQLPIVLIAASLLLVPDDRLRDLLLGYTLAATASIGLRRWLVRHQHPAMAALTLLGMVIAAIVYALHLDGTGQATESVSVVLATVAVALVSWLRIEAPAGGL